MITTKVGCGGKDDSSGRQQRRRKSRRPSGGSDPGSSPTQVLGDEAIAAASDDNHNMVNLQRMVRDLKEMDASWRESNSPLPTFTEQTLYGLILGRVASDIYLFHREEIPIIAHLPVDQLKSAAMQSAHGKHLLTGMNFHKDGEEGDVIGLYENLSDRIDDTMDVGYLPVELLWECRDSMSNKLDLHEGAERSEGFGDAASKTSVKASADDESLDGKGVMKTREQTLIGILRGLDEMRRLRVYAPPACDELKCYQEIRKWITSTICYFRAKDHWLSRLRESGFGNPFATDIPSNGSTKCIFSCTAAASGVAASPAGHRATLAFDELPEIRFILRRCKDRLSDIIASSPAEKGELMDDVKCMDDVNVDAGSRKRTQVPQELEVKKNRKREPHTADAAGLVAQTSKAVAGTDESVIKSREEYLKEILGAFLKLETLCLSTWPTSAEVRLYTQILEHVYASMWLFVASIDSTEGEQCLPVCDGMMCQETEGDMMHDSVRGDLADNVNGLSDATMGTEERKTREQYLQEIVRLVEVMKSSFLCTPPTAQETALYGEISKYFRPDPMLYECYQSQKVQGNVKGGGAIGEGTEKMTLLRHLVKGVYEREKELLNELDNEFVDILRMLSTSVPEECKASEALNWIEEHKDVAMCELKEWMKQSAQEPELIERAIMTLGEVGALSAELVRKFNSANAIMNPSDPVHDQASFQEAWSASHILQ